MNPVARGLVLIERVIEVTMHNPITGLGPAAYRFYARMTPLAYGGAFGSIRRSILTTTMWTSLPTLGCWDWPFSSGFPWK